MCPPTGFPESEANGGRESAHPTRLRSSPDQKTNAFNHSGGQASQRPTPPIGRSAPPLNMEREMATICCIFPAPAELSEAPQNFPPLRRIFPRSAEFSSAPSDFPSLRKIFLGSAGFSSAPQNFPGLKRILSGYEGTSFGRNDQSRPHF